jgi:hypothetical protein
MRDESNALPSTGFGNEVVLMHLRSVTTNDLSTFLEFFRKWIIKI